YTSCPKGGKVAARRATVHAYHMPLINSIPKRNMRAVPFQRWMALTLSMCMLVDPATASSLTRIHSVVACLSVQTLTHSVFKEQAMAPMVRRVHSIFPWLTRDGRRRFFSVAQEEQIRKIHIQIDDEESRGALSVIRAAQLRESLSNNRATVLGLLH